MDNRRQIILDTETTGLYPNAAENPDRLIEFAGLEMRNRSFTDEKLHLYVHPQRDIPAEAAAVHGITLDKLEGKPVFAEVAQQIADFIRGAELVIHNAKFDVGFLDAEFGRLGMPSVEDLGCTVIDTLAMARERYPGQKNNLDALCNRLGVDRSRRVLHGALIDCELLGGVYLAMTRGQFSLTDAFEQEDDDIPQTAAPQPADHLPRPAGVKLKVLAADSEECAAHEAFLDQIDKSCGGTSIYRADAGSAQQ